MEKKSLGGRLYLCLRWPLIAVGYFAIVTIIVNFIDPRASYTLGMFVLLFSLVAIYLQFRNINFLEPAVLSSIGRAARIFSQNVMKVETPYGVISESGRILWMSDAFKSIDEKMLIGSSIKSFFPELTPVLLSRIKNEPIELLSSYDNRKYRINLKYIPIFESEDGGEAPIFDDNDRAILVFLYDETNYYNLKQEFEDNKQVSGYIYIDNYYEISETMEDSKASMLIAMVDRKLTRYISFNSGIVKKLEKDKYFFVTTKKEVEEMIADRFSILEQTKEIVGTENNFPLTLSIGIGYEGKSLESNHDLAKTAIDMALGRGGDQVVVKKGQDTFFFGGKSASTVSNLRVRARVKATAFKETLESREKVLIMGHKNGDFDSFGASLGAYIMAKHLGKDAHIVANVLTKAVDETKQNFLNNDAYDKKMFLSGEEAVEFADSNTLLIIVDHNAPDISDEPRLFEKEMDVVLFDHHRISQRSFTDTLLSYIDAGASSTCEIIVELMMYFEDRLSIKQLDADCMLGGIMIDTVNFSFQTGSKTFDAASFLKKRGADTDRIKKRLRVDMDFEKLKNEVISNAEVYRNGFALATLENCTDTIERSVAKAEIANELINIKGVKASIVISKEGNGYSLSSRSIDEVNVQVLMEKMGGGGHRSAAGAYVKAESFTDAVNKIKATIDDFVKMEVR